MNEMSLAADPKPLDLESLRARAAASTRHPLTLALLALTFGTGVVDAISFLGLGQVFTANMTGNIAFLGFAIASGGSLDVVGPLVSVGFFLAGAAAGGVLARRCQASHPTHVALALGVEATLIAVAGVLAATIEVRAHALSGDVLIAVLGLAMGVRNATTRRIGVPDLTTTVVTTLMAALAAESPLAGGSGRGSTRRILAVLAMLAGAVLGALLLQVSLVLPLALAAALALATCIAYVPSARRAA